jgi:hypothetical protein
MVLSLVLEWKNTLCHNCFTSLVIVVLLTQAFYLSGFAGINEVLYFFAGGLGRETHMRLYRRSGAAAIT